MHLLIDIRKKNTGAGLIGFFFKCLCIITLLFCCFFLLLFDFWEIPYVVNIIGWTGVTVVTLLAVVFPTLFLWSFFTHKSFIHLFLLLVALPVYFFYADWTISEFPHSLEYLGLDEQWLLENYARNHDNNSQLLKAKELFPNADVVSLKNILDRIALSNPSLLKLSPVETIKKISAENDTDPVLLFYWLYLASWYGEASAGKIPLFSKMTSETFRDFVQIHIPPVLVESRPFFLSSLAWVSRKINLDREVRFKLNFKLKYLFHKSTYDISMEPYDTQLFSDVLLVFLEYPQEFSDILDPSDSQENNLDSILRKNYRLIASSCLRKPYDKPYVHMPETRSYYDTYRENIVIFSRATFYKFIDDFEFSTRVQSLIVRYYTDYYKQALGEQYWVSLSSYQKAVLIALLRDVYIPNVGKLSYNYYSLPEINCTPVEYITQEILDNREDVIMADISNPWYPKEVDAVIWGITGNKLKTLRKVWSQLLIMEQQ